MSPLRLQLQIGNADFRPKFARPFIEGGRYVIDALARFDAAVKHGKFSAPEGSYS